jgi:ATP-dependent Clp protease ATP-binding subunit ClpA
LSCHQLQSDAQLRLRFTYNYFLPAQGLDRQQIGTIVRLQAKRVADRLASRKIKLELDDSAVEWLADKVCDCTTLPHETCFVHLQ